MNNAVKKALTLVLLLLLWILGGAWLFVLVEYKEEDGRKAKAMVMRELYHNMSTKYNMTMMEFTNLAYTIHDALTLPREVWNYETAILFALQTVTTIGYGYITPTTPTGQILCILYVLTGIPITMLALKSVGDLIAAGFLTIIRRVEKRLWKTAEPKHAEIKCTVVTFVSMMVLIIIGAAIQVHAEGLTYVEGIYMWFITFTTVGYGDFYPGNSLDSRPVNWNNTFVEDMDDLHPTLIALVHISNILFFVLGLCLVASVLNSLARAVEKHRRPTRLISRLSRNWSRKYQMSNECHNSKKTLEKKVEIIGAKQCDGICKEQKVVDKIEPRTDISDPNDNASSNTMSKSGI